MERVLRRAGRSEVVDSVGVCLSCLELAIRIE